jgi:hypothetical protein
MTGPGMKMKGNTMTTDDALAIVNGDLLPQSAFEMLKAYQLLSDTGAIWRLGFQYGNRAQLLLNMGLLDPPPEDEFLRPERDLNFEIDVLGK